MTTLGEINGVTRTLYRDDVEQINVYPLDQKIQLLEIDGRFSRYTGNFAHLVGDYYARLPERDVQTLLQKTLSIDLEKDSMTAIGSAVAQPFLPKHYDDTEVKGTLQAVDYEPGFIEQRINEIEANPERDVIIGNALIGDVSGVEYAYNKPEQNAAYILADGTGVSGLPRELSNLGKNGGSAKTFEAKIGSIFTQSFNSNGLPLLTNGSIYREPDSTRYIGTVEKVGQFTSQLEEFANKNGVNSANQIVFLSDGAIWLENLRVHLFPNSIGVVDFYHASEHLYKLVDVLVFYSRQKKALFTDKCYHLLELGEIDQMADLIRQKTVDSNRESVEKQLAYFIGNKDKMRYGLFRAAGLFIGSGVIEAACKTIVENRLNRSGMRWTKNNAANVIALRCAIYSGSYDAVA